MTRDARIPRFTADSDPGDEARVICSECGEPIVGDPVYPAGYPGWLDLDAPYDEACLDRIEEAAFERGAHDDPEAWAGGFAPNH